MKFGEYLENLAELLQENSIGITIKNNYYLL